MGGRGAGRDVRRRQTCYDLDRADGYLTAQLSHGDIFVPRSHLGKAVEKKRESGAGGSGCVFGGFFFCSYSQGGSGQPEGAGRAHGEGPLTRGQAGGVERKDSLVG